VYSPDLFTPVARSSSWRLVSANRALAERKCWRRRCPSFGSLAKKVALVTGGSRGIGAAIAKRLAADGASVAITYAKDATAASAVVKAIELGGGKAIAIQADAANVEEVKGVVEKVFSTFGRLDVLVNNAGTAIPKTFEETTLEEMDLDTLAYWETGSPAYPCVRAREQ
jgi:hypothetical protein